jgi:hypothetical protein
MQQNPQQQQFLFQPQQQNPLIYINSNDKLTTSNVDLSDIKRPTPKALR